MRPSPLQILAPLPDDCAYGHQARQLAVELVRRGIDVRWLRIPWTRPIVKEEFPLELQGREGRCVSEAVLHFCLPEQVVTSVRPDARHVNFTMCETSRLPPTWVERALQLPLTLVPSLHSQKVWIESGVPPDRIKVCPLGVDVDRFRRDNEPLMLTTKQGQRVSQFTHRFLSVSGLTDRENIPGLVRAWKAALRPQDNAVLMLKLSGVTPEKMRELARDTGDLSTAPVVVVNHRLPFAEMPKLFAAATCYVSASRGEGWDMSMLEAAATGLQLIAPRHSVYLDVLDDASARLVEAERRPSNDARCADCWEPDFDDLVFAIREVLDGRALRSDARTQVALSRTWEQAVDQLLRHLQGLV